jgi:hypothetical protein
VRAKRKREGVVGVGAPRDRGRRKERRGARARQSDHMVGMAPGGAVRGDSARSRWRRAGEQGRTAGARATGRGCDRQVGPGRGGAQWAATVVRERKRERQGGGGAPTCRPGRRDSNLI